MSSVALSVSLRISGVDFIGWTSVRITRSIEQLAHTFNLVLTDAWGEPNKTGKTDEPPQIKAGDACELWYGNELVISGYVDDALPSYDAEKHTVSVSGRSKVADLIDCGLPGQQFKNQTLVQLARAVVKPFGISVRANTSVGEAFKQPSVEPGQTGFEFLEKHARQRGVRLISDADGALVITRTGKTVVPDVLELGVNILAASGRFSVRDRFNKITVVGQTAGSESWNGSAAAFNTGSATDSAVRSSRKHVMTAEQSADTAACKSRAEWQRNTAYGKGQALTYTVNGWRHSAGLWQANTLVTVRDKWMRLNGEQLLIAAVQFILDAEGERTELQVMPPEAFDLVALPEKKTGAVKTWGPQKK